MKPSDRIMLAFLTAKGGTETRGCWWRQKKMAEETGLSVRTVQRAIARLEELKYIRVQHRFATTNLYFVDHQEKKQKAFFRDGVVTWGYVKMADIIFKTEVSTPKESSSAAESSSERKPRRAPESADDIGYREQFTEALLGLGCVLGDMRPGLIEAAAREACRSWLSADRAAQVYESLDWTRIANADNFIGLFVTIFRDELSKSHRLRESESRRNVSPKIAQPVQSFVPDTDWEAELAAFPLTPVVPVQPPKPAAPTMTAEDRKLYAEFVRLYPFASINQFQAFKAEHLAVVAPTSSEQGRVSPRSLDRAIPLQQFSGRGAAFSSQSQDWAQVGGESSARPAVQPEGPSRSDEASRPIQQLAGVGVDGDTLRLGRTGILRGDERPGRYLEDPNNNPSRRCKPAPAGSIPARQHQIPIEVQVQEKQHDQRDGMALLVSPLPRVDSGATVPDVQPLVLGRVSGSRVATVDEGILHEKMLRRRGRMVALRANAPRHGSRTAEWRAPTEGANAARHGPGKAQWGAPTSKEFLEVAEARAG